MSHSGAFMGGFCQRDRTGPDGGWGSANVAGMIGRRVAWSCAVAGPWSLRSQCRRCPHRRSLRGIACPHSASEGTGGTSLQPAFLPSATPAPPADVLATTRDRPPTAPSTQPPSATTACQSSPSPAEPPASRSRGRSTPRTARDTSRPRSGRRPSPPAP